MITNTLQRKLSKLQKEKCEMESALEQEQEFIVNRLTKQLEALKGTSTPNLRHSNPDVGLNSADILKAEV